MQLIENFMKALGSSVFILTQIRRNFAVNLCRVHYLSLTERVYGFNPEIMNKNN